MGLHAQSPVPSPRTCSVVPRTPEFPGQTAPSHLQTDPEQYHLYWGPFSKPEPSLILRGGCTQWGGRPHKSIRGELLIGREAAGLRLRTRACFPYVHLIFSTDYQEEQEFQIQSCLPKFLENRHWDVGLLWRVLLWVIFSVFYGVLPSHFHVCKMGITRGHPPSNCCKD